MLQVQHFCKRSSMSQEGGSLRPIMLHIVHLFIMRQARTSGLPTHGMQEGAACRQAVLDQIDKQQDTEQKVQLMSALQSGTQGMKLNSEAVVKALEASQYVTSTNDFGEDPYATDPAAERALPSLSRYPDEPEWMDSPDLSFTAPRKDPLQLLQTPVTCEVLLPSLGAQPWSPGVAYFSAPRALTAL